jgi:Flp pilus assembly protein TadB
VGVTGVIWVLAAAAVSVFFLAVGMMKKAPSALEKVQELDGAEAAACSMTQARAPAGRYLLELPYRVIPRAIRVRLDSWLETGTAAPREDLPRLGGMTVWVTAVMPLAVIALSGFSIAGMAAAPVLMAFGLLLPRVMAGRRNKRYLASVRKALPDTADMLYALVLGGKNLDQAFRGASHQSKEPLRSVLMRAVHEVELGSTRAEAFARICSNCPVRELDSLLQSLLQAEKRGSSLSMTLSVFSREIRLRRRDELRRSAAKAPLKMLAPLVFLILPASVLLTVGPTMLATVQRMF